MGEEFGSHKPNSVNLSWKEYIDLMARVHDLEEENEELNKELDVIKQQYDNLISEP